MIVRAAGTFQSPCISIITSIRSPTARRIFLVWTLGLGPDESPVADQLDRLGPHVPIARASVVDADILAAGAVQELVYGLAGGLAEEIPESDVDRRIGSRLCPGAGVADVRLQGSRVPVYMLGILSQQIRSSCLVDVVLDRLGIEVGLAQPDQAFVRVQLNEEEVWELPRRIVSTFATLIWLEAGWSDRPYQKPRCCLIDGQDGSATGIDQYLHRVGRSRGQPAQHFDGTGQRDHVADQCRDVDAPSPEKLDRRGKVLLLLVLDGADDGSLPSDEGHEVEFAAFGRNPDQHDSSTLADRFEGELDGHRATGAFDGGVGAWFADRIEDLGRGGAIPGRDDTISPERGGQPAPRLSRLHHDHPASSGAFRDLEHEQSDRARPGDHQCSTRTKLSFANGPHRYLERFDEGCLMFSHLVWHRNTGLGRHTDKLNEAPVAVKTHCSPGLAERVAPLAAVDALAAVEAYLWDHAIAQLELADVGAHRRNGSPEFVTEGQRGHCSSQRMGADRNQQWAARVFLEVGAADSTEPDTQLDLMWCWRRDREVLDPNVTPAEPPQRSHVRSTGKSLPRLAPV